MHKLCPDAIRGGFPLLGAEVPLATFAASAPSARHRHTTDHHKPWRTNKKKKKGCALTLTSTSLVTRHTWGGSDTATSQARHGTIPQLPQHRLPRVSTHLSHNSYHRVRVQCPPGRLLGSQVRSPSLDNVILKVSNHSLDTKLTVK